MFDRRWRKGIKVRVSMCDPTALLDLVPSEGLLKRPSMDYNEYTYCYGGGRGGWYFSSLLFSSSSSCSHRSFSPLGTSRCGRTCGIFFLSLLSLSLPILLWSADPSILRSSNEDETIFTAVKIGRDAIRADLWSGRNFIILPSINRRISRFSLEYPFPSNGDPCCFSFTLFPIPFFCRRENTPDGGTKAGDFSFFD